MVKLRARLTTTHWLRFFFVFFFLWRFWWSNIDYYWFLSDLPKLFCNAYRIHRPHHREQALLLIQYNLINTCIQIPIPFLNCISHMTPELATYVFFKKKIIPSISATACMIEFLHFPQLMSTFISTFCAKLLCHENENINIFLY